MTDETNPNPTNENPVVKETQEVDPVEQRATEFGWKPKEKWVEEGHSEEDWIPAKHFLRYGELKQQTISKDNELKKTTKLIQRMKDHYVKVRADAVEEAIRKLKAERKVALENNDLTKAEEIRDQLEETKEKMARQPILPPEIEQEVQQVQQPQNSPPPEFFEFHERNPWYIVDPTKQDDISREADALGTAAARKMQVERGQVDLKALYKEVEQKIRKLYPDKFGTPPSPQQNPPGRPRASTRSSPQLTDEQLEVAKAFGLTPEKYLESLNSYKGR